VRTVRVLHLPLILCCGVGYMTEEDGEEVERVDVPQLWYLEGWESMLRLIRIPGGKE
jgi:hypothetical protein